MGNFNLPLLLVVCFIVGKSHGWFFNDFADDRADSDLLSALNTRVRDLEPLGSVNLHDDDDDDDGELLSDRVHTRLTGEAAADILSSLLDGGLHDASNVFNFINRPTKVPWWKGENVCVERSERNESTDATATDGKQGNSSDVATVGPTQQINNPFLFLGSAAFKTCRHMPNKYICSTSVYSKGKTETTELTYKCCPSTRRNFEKDVCEKVEAKPAVETAKSLDATRFADSIEKSVEKSFIDRSNMTIFAPSDKSIAAYWKYVDGKQQNVVGLEALARETIDGAIETKDDDSAENEIPTGDKSETADKNTVANGRLLDGRRTLAHIVNGQYDIHDLENEQMLSTVEGLPVRINLYHSERGPLVTANCAVVKSANHPLTNDGILHVTDAVLPAVTKSIKQIISDNPEFSSFRKMLEKSQLLDMLGEEGNYTVFVPNDATISNGADEFKFLQDGEACVTTVLKSHIVPRTLCSGAIGSMRVMTRSLSGNWLTLERENPTSLLVGPDSRTTTTDIVASNGVIHVISKIIIPSSAEPVSKLLKERNHTSWLTLIEKAGLKEELEVTGNRTIFVPSEEALIAAKLTSADVDPDKLKDIIRFHISDKSVCSCQMTDNLQLPSILPGKQLRINTYESGSVFIGLDPTITVQCGLIQRKDEKACNFMVHEVDRVLTPASQTILDIVNSDQSYAILKKIIAGTKIEAELKNGTLGAVTLLAPTDEAFANLTKEEMQKLDDKTSADQLLRRHLLTDVVCCNGIGATGWPFSDEVITVSGSSLSVRRRNPEQVVFGAATTTSCDRLATDGLLHSVDKVMMPRPIKLNANAVKYIDPHGSEIVLFGI